MQPRRQLPPRLPRAPEQPLVPRAPQPPLVPPSPPPNPPPWPAPLTLQLLLMLGGADLGTLQQRGMVQRLQDATCAVLQAGTAAPHCTVYAVRPGSVVLGVAVMVDGASEIIPVYLRLLHVLDKIDTFFDPNYKATFGIGGAMYGNVITEVPLPSPLPPSLSPPPSAPDAPPQTGGSKDVGTDVPGGNQLPTGFSPPPPPNAVAAAAVTAAPLNVGLVVGVVLLGAVLAGAAAAGYAYYRHRKSQADDGMLDDMLMLGIGGPRPDGTSVSAGGLGQWEWWAVVGSGEGLWECWSWGGNGSAGWGGQRERAKSGIS